MITVFGPEDKVTRYYPNFSTVYDEEEFNILVTYTVDGEPSAPLYMRRSRSTQESLLKFLRETEPGFISDIRLWRLLAVVN